MPDGEGLGRLSLSESRVARLVAEGLSDQQIADRLGVTVVQVSAELAEVFRKLGLRSRTELALLAPEATPGSDTRSREGSGKDGIHGK
jgi:DNA-binding NarL/FixJ family response regulator